MRQLLAAAVRTALGALTTTGTNVFGWRVNPLQGAELPGLCIYVQGDDAAPETIHAPVLVGRDIEVIVKGYAAANTALDDTLETIGKEVETALAAELSIGSPAKKVLLNYRGCAKDLEAGETQAGSIEMRFSAGRLFNVANAPDVFS